MTTKNYYETELHVHFTREELSVIMSALATEYFSERNAGHNYSAENAWKVRNKVEKFADIYDNSAVL